MNAAPHFDIFAEDYDEHLNSALSASGEDKQYFANGRVQFLAQILARLRESPRFILDYGCGTGDTSLLLLNQFKAEQVLGLDLSSRSLDIARERIGLGKCRFMGLAENLPAGSIDLAYCNGVFHHIQPANRASAVDYIFHCLRPGGLFAFWENNPWNPGTRFVMSQCAFDDDAIMLNSVEAKGLLRQSGFEIIGMDYCFVFPRALRLLRPLENLMSGVPLGGQYQILCRRPARPATA